MQIPEQKVMVKQSEGHVFNSGVAKRISITPLLKCACSFIFLRNLYIERVRVVKRISCLVWIIGRCATNTNRVFLEKKNSGLNDQLKVKWNSTLSIETLDLISFRLILTFPLLLSTYNDLILSASNITSPWYDNSLPLPSRQLALCFVIRCLITICHLPTYAKPTTLPTPCVVFDIMCINTSVGCNKL